jgi:hypothetical protein
MYNDTNIRLKCRTHSAKEGLFSSYIISHSPHSGLSILTLDLAMLLILYSKWDAFI